MMLQELELPQSQTEESLLSIRDLHTWFELRRLGFIRVGHVRALDGVSFELKRGETIAVVGESGCGKSTLAKTILGLHAPTKGEVYFEGRKVDTRDQEVMKWYRSQVGYVQQDPYGALPPFMTVFRILEEPLIINGVTDKAERTERIRNALESVRLTPVDDFLQKFPHMLSGGQQQRLVIARAKILEPKMIIADEPVSMLDASVRVEILELLRRLQVENNISIIYITHDLSTVRYFSDRIFVMYGAKVIEEGSVDKLIENPSHPYTQALLDAISDPDPDNVDKFRDVPPGEPPSLVNPPAGCRFHPRCPKVIEGLCDATVPPRYVIDPDHLAACWLYQEREAR